MKTNTYLARGVLMTLVVFLTSIAMTKGQAYTASTANCAITANTITFDVLLTNTSTTDERFNSVVIDFNYALQIMPTAQSAGVTFGFVNDGLSDFPLSFPPNSAPTFSVTTLTTTPRVRVSTGTAVYTNGSCTAPLIGPGLTKKIGRFVITNTTAN